MVKSADARIKKYTAKYDPTVVSARFTATKDLAVSEAGVRFAEAAQMEATVKMLIEDVIPSPTLIPNYLAFAREVFAKSHKYGGLVLWNEAQAAKAKWVARDLDSDVLDSILAALGISIAIYGGS
jgi:hypothetical protein